MMKKLLTLLLGIFAFASSAQNVPYGISYQAIALDQNGQPIPGIDIVGRPIDDAEIGVRFTILEGSISGPILYQEEHEVLTDLYGMFQLVVGHGQQVSANPFASINWEGDKFLKVEISINNNGSFELSAIQQLMSVPYSFLAQDVINNDDADADPLNEIQTLSIDGDSVKLTRGGAIRLPIDPDTDPVNELQFISRLGDTITLSNGGSIVLPFDPDTDITNEIQYLSLLGDTIALSDGGSIVLPFDPDTDITNEIQYLSILGDTVALSNGGSIVLPLDPDMDTANEIQFLSYSNDTLSISKGGKIILPFSSKAEFIDDLNDAKNQKGSLGLGLSTLQNDSTGNNTAVGNYSQTQTQSGSMNVSLGVYTLNQNTSGGGNTAIGSSSLGGNTTGNSNTAVGIYALAGWSGPTTGYANTAIGSRPLAHLKSGSTNIGIGSDPLFNLKTGSNNIALGDGVASGITTGNNNVFIGSFSNSNDSAIENAVAIGFGAQVQESSTIQLGNESISKVKTAGDFIGGGASLSDSSTTSVSLLTLSSNTQGFLPPRMTLNERDNISTPMVGLTIYCLDCILGGELQTFNGTIWRSSTFASVNSTPAIGINSPDYLGSDSSTLSIVVLNSGGLPLLSNGLQISVDPTFATAVIQITNGTPSTGTTSFNIGSLTPNTTYYYRGFASNSLGLEYSNIASFATLSGTNQIIPPSLFISGDIDANHISITISASFVNPGSNPIMTKGFCYGLTSDLSSCSYTNEGSNATDFTSLIGNLLSDTTYFLRAYAATATDTFYTNISTVNTTISTQLYIGQLYQGGVIFYVDGTGQHGLIASTSDLGRYPWGCQGNTIDSTQSDLGFGLHNSNRISANCYSSNTIASTACLNAVINRYGDWYLPSFDELQLLKTNLYSNGYTQYFDTDEGSYWSSTEISATQAMQLEFYFGGWYVGTPPSKTNQRKVHPIRSF